MCFLHKKYAWNTIIKVKKFSKNIQNANKFQTKNSEIISIFSLVKILVLHPLK